MTKLENIKTRYPDKFGIKEKLRNGQTHSSIRVGCGRFNTDEKIEIAADEIYHAVESLEKIRI